MRSRDAVTAVVARELLVIADDRASSVELSPETRLGADGLGLDSIDQAQLLIACETAFDKPLTDLLRGGPLTFGSVVDYFLDGE